MKINDNFVKYFIFFEVIIMFNLILIGFSFNVSENFYTLYHTNIFLKIITVIIIIFIDIKILDKVSLVYK